MFTLIFLACLFLVLLAAGTTIGLFVFGIVLFVFGCCNLWRTKYLEPYDYKDAEHMERAKKRMKSKAIIQMVIGAILFLIFMI